MDDDTYLSDLARQLDWQHPLLAATPVDARPASLRAQVLLAVRAMRAQPADYFGFAPDYHATLAAAATDADRALAAERLDTALASDIYYPCHSNAIAALGPDVLSLAMTAARAETLAAAILARQADWPRNIWTFGLTHGVIEMLRFIAPLPEVPDETFLPILGWLCAIGPTEWHSARSWNDAHLGPSGHNWYIHSHFGLWSAAAIAGFCRCLQPMRALAPTQLEREVDILFAADGWSKEGAAGYHMFAAGNVIAWTRLAERHGLTFSPAFHDKLRRIADATWRFQGPDGDGPIFGDASPSGGKAGDSIGSMLVGNDFGTRTRRLAARYGLTDALGAANALAPARATESLLDHGDDLAPALAALSATTPPLDTALPLTGLYALRNRWATDGDWLAFNAKGIGPTVTSHQHADLLNIELCVRGRRLLVDNWYGDITLADGTYQSAEEIRNNPMKRRWRVGSSAHNVVTIDDQDIVPVKQIYRYGWHETPSVESCLNDPRYAWLSGVHEAWRRLENRVASHWRSIFYLRDRYWILMDRLTPCDDSGHVYEQHFHLAPGAVLAADGQAHTTGDGGNLLIAPAPGLTGEACIEPCPHPISSYQNPDHLVYRQSTTEKPVFASVLVPYTDKRPVVAIETVPVQVEGDPAALSAHSATGLRITIDGHTDLFVRQHAHWNAPWTCAGTRSSARLHHSALGDLPDNVLVNG